MQPKRPITLLEFAIAASVAVVPVLLVVLVVVAEMRPSDPSAKARPNGNQHVSLREVAALKTFERAIVRRDAVTAALPTPEALIDAIPQCRSEWDGRGGMMHRIRRLLAPSQQATLSPAQRMAAQFEELDAALKRFSTGANRRVGDAVGFDAGRWYDARARHAASPGRIPRVPRTPVHGALFGRRPARSRRSRAEMAGCLPRWRGAARSSTVCSRNGVPSSMSKSRRGRSRAEIRGAAWPGCIYMGFSAPEADVALPEYFVAGARGAATRLCNEPAMMGVATSDRSGTPGRTPRRSDRGHARR